MGNRPKAFAVWITGLPASGKSAVTARLAGQLRKMGIEVTVLESDALRTLLPTKPVYDEQDRDYFYGSLAFIAHALTEHGISVILDATANRRRYRDTARRQIPQFIEVFIDTPLPVCIQRDPKGIYRMARDGAAAHVPGTQAVYEPPANPDIVIRGDKEDPESAAMRIIDVLRFRDLIHVPGNV